MIVDQKNQRENYINYRKLALEVNGKIMYHEKFMYLFHGIPIFLM